MDDRFDLIFKGELVKGVDPDKTKVNLAQLFKIDRAKVDALFSGKIVVLKRGLSLDAANKYRVAIKKAGARVDLLAQQQSEQAPADFSPAVARRPAEFSPTQSSPLPEQTAAPTGTLALAPVGSDLLRPEEKSKAPPKEVDTSELALEPMEGYLVGLSEQKKEKTVQVVPGNYGISAAGEDLLKPEEREKWVPADVDVSAITVAKAGAPLPTLKAHAPPPPPDTSGIRLQK